MTTTVIRPAARVVQADLCLYATSLRVGDLLIPGFYDIERLDPDSPADGGYQRVLNKARAKKLADYLVSGYSESGAFLPTSIFLATERELEFDSATNLLTINIEQVGPFGVVDGQHRVEGLRMAAEKLPELADFEVPVNIATGLSKIAQMCHFLIVNTTQKSVDKSVEQRIYSRLTNAVSIEDVPHLPKWIRRIVESGDDEAALRIADYLNTLEGSPWCGKIEMANEENKKASINQKTFVKALKKYVLVASNPVGTLPSEKQQRIIANYWSALSKLLDVDRPTVLYKHNGVELFSRFSIPFFTKLANSDDFRVDTMKSILKSTFENLEGNYAGVGHPEWWISGSGEASAMNSAALNRIFPELSKALHRASIDGAEIRL